MPTCVDCGEKATGKYSGPCASCGATTCPAHTHFYVDETNVAVTNSAHPECAECAGLSWQVVRWTQSGDDSLAEYRTPEGARTHAWALNAAHHTTDYTIRRKQIRQPVRATPEGNKE